VRGAAVIGQPGAARVDRDRYRWAILAAAMLAQASAALPMQGLGVLAGFLQHALGLSASGVGLLVTVAGSAPIIALSIVGHLLDRHDERTIVGAGALIAAAGVAMAALAGGLPLLLLGLFVFGIGYSTVQPGGSKSVAVWFPARRGIAMGVRQAGLPLGGAGAALLLPAVVVAWSWRAAFAVSGAVALAGGAVFVAVYRQPPTHGAARPSERLWPRLASQLRAPAMATILMTGVALVTAQYGITTHFIGSLRAQTGITQVDAARVFFVVQIAGVVGRIGLAAASDRPGRGRLAWILLCMAATALLLAVLPWLPADRILGTGIAACLGFFGYGWYGPWVAHVSESCPPGQVGLAIGAAMAVNQIAIVAAPPLLGLISDLCGYRVMWWMLAAALFALTGVVRARLAGHRASPRAESRGDKHHTR
jgi:MFS family permease